MHKRDEFRTQIRFLGAPDRQQGRRLGQRKAGKVEKPGTGKVGVQEQPSWCLQPWRASRRPCRPDSTERKDEEGGARFASSPRLLCCPRPGLCLGPNHAELRLATAKHLDTEDAEHRAQQSPAEHSRAPVAVATCRQEWAELNASQGGGLRDWSKGLVIRAVCADGEASERSGL